jgi:uncharacterized membrane protein
MFGFEIGFNSPWYLLLLGLLPLMWLFSFKSLAGLGNWRRLTAIGLRSIIMLLFILALADVQLLRTSEKMTVIYLLDQSESIPRAKRQTMMTYAIEEVLKHRNAPRGDKASVIVFGYDAKIEIPPFDAALASTGGIESVIERTDATNLAAALKLAQASFPEDAAKRVVIVSDGNENLGDARSVARAMVDSGIGIDAVPIRLETRSEVAVEKVTLPSDIRRGQPIEARVVVSNFTKPGAVENPEGLVRGTLKISRQIGQHEELLSEQEVLLKPGKNVYSFRHTIEQPAVYTYKADFTPADEKDDLMLQNNRATAFTHVRGKGRVLLIEDWANRGNFDFLVKKLQDMNLEVDVQASDQLFTSLAELQGYDSVILADVPRSSGDDPTKEVVSFSDDQIQMLVRNTEQMGSGLIMLGGPNSFGAGGWSNTPLEEAMPVDFQIKNAKIQAVGALVLMMHASELAQGNHWQKVIAREAIKTLGPMDYCGLIHWDVAGDSWLWTDRGQGLIRVSEKRNTMLARLDRMTPGDMPQFEPAMRMALADFNKVNASIKHMIIISDGDPSPPSNALINAYKNAPVPIQITTVAVGTHGPAGSTPLQQIATATGGKYYVVSNPKALPRIYQREARRVSRPLIFEPEGGVRPEITYPHEMLEGIDGPLPPIKGFVLTTVKDNPLVEVSILSPKPDGGANSTVLASWTYGAGRTVAFTCDAGKRWASDWTEWENYDKFFSQMVRWSMRPINEDGKFTVATDIKDGKARVVVTALDKDDEFLNFLTMSGAAVGPDLQPFDIKIRQTAPGRYVGEFDADKSGSFFVTVNPGSGRAPLLAGLSVPYSAEFREHETNMTLLEWLAGLQPKGGERGKVIDGPLDRAALDKLLAVDTFRHNLAKAISSQDVWPWVMLVAACLFFADVFVRRVTIGFEWLGPLVARARDTLLRREREPAVDERLERLRNQKAAIGQGIDDRRAAARFEPQPDHDIGQAQPMNLDEVLSKSGGAPVAPPPRPTTAPTRAESAEDRESYTARLLEAKKRAYKDKKN